MNKALKFALPGAIGLLFAVPAMAQGSGVPPMAKDGAYPMGQYQGANNNGNNWYTPGSNGSNQKYNSNGSNNNPGYSQNYDENGNQGENYSQNGYQGQNNNQNSEENNGQEVSTQFLARVQRRLQQDGFYHQGNVDGQWGPETEDALMNFQRHNSLRQTGQIDLRTLEALNVMNNGQNGSNNSQTFNRGSQGENYSSNNGAPYRYNNENSGHNNQNPGYNNGSSGYNNENGGYNGANGGND